jgi:hypothetical protein
MRIETEPIRTVKGRDEIVLSIQVTITCHHYAQCVATLCDSLHSDCLIGVMHCIGWQPTWSTARGAPAGDSGGARAHSYPRRGYWQYRTRGSHKHTHAATCLRLTPCRTCRVGVMTSTWSTA